MFKTYMNRGVFTLSAAMAAVALVSGACGGGDDTATPTQAASSPAATATAVATAAPVTPSGSGGSAASNSTLGAKFTGTIPGGASVVDQLDLLFKPDKITVKLGDTIYFTNGDTAIHSVNVDTKNILGPGVAMKQKEIATWKPAKAGTYTITCDYHPTMKATVTVQ